jgi:metal-responsive CopG/Arc/MetJ family transcriptional regulator
MNCKEASEMPTEKPRYTVIVDEELLKRIDDFRFENRYPSRSAATLELIKLGMKQLEKEQKEGKKAQKNKPSKENT